MGVRKGRGSLHERVYPHRRRKENKSGRRTVVKKSGSIHIQEAERRGSIVPHGKRTIIGNLRIDCAIKKSNRG